MKEKKHQKASIKRKRKKELEILDNPDIKYLSPSGGVIPIALGSFFNSLTKCKERIVDLRIKMRIPGS